MITDSRKVLVPAGVVGCLVVVALQLALSVREESQTWDEGDHIFAGYMSWKHADFGLNPEHPPLVKLLATVPLLGMPLKVPVVRNRYFKNEAFLDGRDFVFGNDADKILFRSRMAAASLTILLGLVVFAATNEMFGGAAAFIAMALLVFEPNLLAHGATVTTDMGVSLGIFAAVYAFYRYRRRPSAVRLLVAGVAAGFSLAVKHTGLLVFPILFLLAFCEWAAERELRSARNALRHTGALMVLGLIAVLVLWSAYGFRYAARPPGLELNPPLSTFAGEVKPHEATAILTLARWRLLPESYLFGLADVRHVADESQSYLFGKVYPHGVWFYFPAAFLIKSTLGFLGLLILAAAAIATRRLKRPREVLFLTIPPALFLLVSMFSGLNIGLRHILPIYAFLIALIGGGVEVWLRGHRRWIYAVAGLLMLHAISSLRCYPVYLAYANEAWGGPENTYRLLTDSNTDWGQQLKGASRYLKARGVSQCWFAYFAQTAADPAYYGIPCKPLPTISSLWLGELSDVPRVIDGPVLISMGTLSGYETGPGALNPYDHFQRLQPSARIDHGIFVYDGRFEVPLASALPHVYKAWRLLREKQPEKALVEAQAAAATEPGAVRCQLALGDALRASGQAAEARAAYERALAIAKTVEPEFQVGWAKRLEKNLAAQ